MGMIEQRPTLKIFNPDDLPVRPTGQSMHEELRSLAKPNPLNALRDERKLLAELELEFGTSVRCFLNRKEHDQVFVVSATKDGGFQVALRVSALDLNPLAEDKEAKRPVSIRAVFDNCGDFKAAYIGNRKAEMPESVVALIDLAVARRVEQSMDWGLETYEDLPREVLKPLSPSASDRAGRG